MTKNLYRISLKWSLRLHNFAYKLSTRFAVKAEGGLHPKHRIMKYHNFFVENVEVGDRVLDIGCGNGALAFDVAKKADEVVAIDLSAENIRIAKEKYSASNIDYRVGYATKDLADGHFDVIVLSNVLEHIENRGEFLSEIKDLAPKFLIRVPMIDRDWITLYKKEQGVESRLDPTHFIEYTMSGFISELKTAGLEIVKDQVIFGEIWAVVKKV